MLNPKHLRTFLTVAHSGSLVRGGHILHRAQSAVTRAVKELERELGCELFERHARGVVLTGIGRVLLARVERAFDEMESARSDFAAYLGAERWHRNAPIFDLALSAQRLIILVQLAEQRSMSAVASSLGISQSAVSQTLREVETGLGLEIFKRAPVGLFPTPLGATLALHLRRALAEIRIAEDEVRADRGGMRGVINVGSLSLGRTRILPHALARFLMRHPNVTVRTEEGTYDTLSRHLREGELDFILGALRATDATSGFEREVVAEDLMGIVVRRGHPLAHRPSLELADVVGSTWVLPRRPAPTRELLEATLRDRGLPAARVQLETTDLAITLGVLLTSDFVTAISPMLYRHEMAAGLVVTLPVRLPETRRPLGMLRREGASPSPAAAALMDFIREEGRLAVVSFAQSWPALRPPLDSPGR